jgi:Fe-S-cluster-containing hydrogenase component 2
MEVCAEDAVRITSSGGKVIIDSGRCSGCGKCVAACPCGVFSLKPVERATTFEKIRNMIHETGELVIACHECPDSDAVPLRSLAFADRRLITKAALAGAKKITLIHDRCEECRKDCLKT